MRAQAKKLSLEALKSYDPSRGAALGTHIVNQLRRLYRSNYEASQALRMSEELQSGAALYRQALDELTAKLGREPTLTELQDATGWTKSRISRLQHQMRGETPASMFEFDPGVVELDEADYRIDFVYNDLSPRDKKIFEWTTGYGGAPKMPKVEIAERLGVSPVVISQRASMIAKRIMEGAGLAS